MTDNTRQSRSGCLGFLVKFFVGIIFILIILGLVGWVYQSQAEAAFFEENPALGELVDVDGRDMHIYCIGEGSPTVILDAGLGGWSVDVAELQTQLAETTRVCAYDRAGYGWSDFSDTHSLDEIVTDLHSLLANADIEAPYIMLGFSFTGLTTRLYYENYPEQVIGMVLLDPSHEDDRSLFSEELLNQQQSMVGMYGFFGSLAQIGVVRILNPAEMSPYAPFISADPVSPELYYAGVSSNNWWRTSQQEFEANLLEESPFSVSDYGDLPLLVFGTDTISEGFDDIAAARLEALESLAGQSTEGQFIVAEDTNHEEILKRYDLLVPAVVEMVETVRGE